MFHQRRRHPARAMLCALALASFVHLSSATARAEVRTETRHDQLIYDFRDADWLGADPTSPYGTIFKQRILKQSRVLLIRPRSTFVPEMLKSVETI